MTLSKRAQVLHTPLCESLGVDLPIWNAGMGEAAPEQSLPPRCPTRVASVCWAWAACPLR